MNEDQLWTKWRAAYGSDGARIVRDGIGEPDSFERSKKRLLFVLREPHGWDGADMRDQLRQGVKYAVWRRIAEWAAAILLDYPPFNDICDTSIQDAALRQIAVINVKKLPGGSSASQWEIDDHAFRHRDLLRHQIDVIAPNVIVACGTFGVMRWILEDNIAAVSDDFCKLSDGATLLGWRHPAQRGPKRERYESFVELCKHVAV